MGGAASVKYRTKDLIKTMHRLDKQLRSLDELAKEEHNREMIEDAIKKREQALLPVYEQISVQFCDLHDTPGRMKAVGVIEKEVDWRNARSFFYWRLRRKLAEFDLRKKVIEASKVGRGLATPTPIQASSIIKGWFLETPTMKEDLWENDKVVLTWMGERYGELEQKVVTYAKESVTKEVVQVMSAGGNTQVIGMDGIVEGISQVYNQMTPTEREDLKQKLANALS